MGEYVPNEKGDVLTISRSVYLEEAAKVLVEAAETYGFLSKLHPSSARYIAADMMSRCEEAMSREFESTPAAPLYQQP